MSKSKKIILITASSILLVFLLTLIIAVCILPFRNLIGAMSVELGTVSQSTIDYVRGGKRKYKNIPDILTMNDGTKVSGSVDFEKRKDEILELFEKYVYGKIPTTGFETSFELVERGEALEGRAIRQQVKITVKTEKGQQSALMLLYLPNNGKKNPVIIGLNFKGNHVCYNDKEILPSYCLGDLSQSEIDSQRGDREERWPFDKIISAGCGIATIDYEDFALDHKKKFKEGLYRLFDDENFMAISCWSFGLMRGVDYLFNNADEDIKNLVDTNGIISIGHSRLGKTSLWAGANDQRISWVVSNDSGCTGAALSRGNRGETVTAINMGFPHWFVKEYKKYNTKVNKLPIDQHMLLAVIAPRGVYVASGNKDLWADPVNEYLSLKYARVAYEQYGLENDLPKFQDELPKPGTQIATKYMGYHICDEKHAISLDDWKFYLDYVKQYVINK